MERHARTRGRGRIGIGRLLALLAVLALAAPAAPASVLGATSLFQPYQATDVGSRPIAAAIGDVTGDGRADVVMTTGYGQDPANDFRLWVFAQTGAGGLATPVSYATAATYGWDPTSVAIGDVDGDGRNDVVVGVAWVGIQVFPGTDTGTLGTPTLVPGQDAHKVRIAVLDKSGRPQVVGIGWGTDTATIYADTGAGMAVARVYPVRHSGYDDLELADVTGDGLIDIVVMSGQTYATPNVSVLVNSVGGTFSGPAEYRVGDSINTHGIGAGDVTGDGRTDVVASYGGNSPTSAIAVFPGAADALGSPVSSSSYDIPSATEVADVDHDGRNDVVVLHDGWLRVGVYRGQAGGGIGVEELFPIPQASHYDPHGLAVGDVNGDGWLDLAIADSNNGLVVLRNSGPPEAPPSAPTGLVTSPNLAAGVGLAWQPPASQGSSAILGYRIYRGSTSGGETLLATINNVLSYTDVTVANGTTTYYQVSAFNREAEGPRSAEAVAQRGTAPSAPRSPSASTAKAGITVTWTAPATDGGSPVTGYRVYRGTTSGGETFLAAVGPATTSYLDTAVTKRVRYWYRITAVNALGESVPSAEVSATGR